jgi:hypothetical protein
MAGGKGMLVIHRRELCCSERFDNTGALCYPLRGTKGHDQPVHTKMQVGAKF